MFLVDLIIGEVMGQVIDWIYGQIVGFLVSFFELMGEMGVELFEISWTQSIVTFFSRLGWALYLVGLVVAVFECGIESQNGRGSVKEVFLNALKGFLAVSLFHIVPIELYSLSVNLQGQIGDGLTGRGTTLGDLANDIMDNFSFGGDLTASSLSGLTPFGNPTLTLFVVVMMGYAITKVFFANLKRGGILLTQICAPRALPPSKEHSQARILWISVVGSLYMFSIPRGYGDGFVSWCKQIIALCFSSFMQATILTAGLLMLLDHPLMALGLMLSATEIPRIAEAFGLDTSTKLNLMGTVYNAQTAVNLSKTLLNTVSPAKVP